MTIQEINACLRESLKERDVASFRKTMLQHPEALRARDGCCVWLCRAAMAGQIEVIAFLIDDMRVGIDEVVDPLWDQTPLDTAIANDRGEVTEWLLGRGAAVNHTVKGHPNCIALKRAVDGNDFELVRKLVEHGADINATGKEGRSALMMSVGHPEIHEYLLSHGGVDPRETTPPDYKSGHQRILEFMQDYAEEDESWGKLLRWKMEFPGDPNITLYCRGPGEESDYNLLFTVGASDVQLEPEEGRQFGDGLELITYLPKNWRIKWGAKNDPKWNWPMVALVDLARRIHARGKQVRLYQERDMSRAVWSIEMNGDPPRPIAAGTQLCGWLLLGAEHCELPDFRGVSFDVATPIYREEADFVRECLDYEPLLRRFVALDIPRTVSLNRPNAVIDWPAGKPEPSDEELDE